MPASPTLRNSSDPPLSPPPHKHSLYPLCFSPPLHHALIKVLGNGAWLCLCWEPSALSRPFLQPRVPAGVGNRIPPPPFPPTYFNTCVLPMLVPIPYLHPMHPHHLDTDSYPQPLSNPTWVPIYPIFLPLPPQTPDSFLPQRHTGFPP